MTPNRSMLLLAASGLALTLGGCKVDNRPLLSQLSGSSAPDVALPQPGLPGATPYDVAAYAGNLPPPPPPLPPARAYPYAERAYGLDRAFYEVPPDYGFTYGDEQPWVWQAADESLMFGEPYGDDYRFYYYEPGVDYPYFVRDAGYGYAYGDGGALLAIFDAAGALLSPSDYSRYYPQARDYWRRGADLRTVYARAPRSAIDPGLWSQRAPRIARIEQPWMAAPDRQPAWRQWRASAPPAMIQNFEGQRPARMVEQRADNGRHLGWDRGRHEGWNGAPDAPQAFAPHPRFEGHEGFARQDRGQGFEARSADRHGYNAAFEGTPRQTGAPGRGHHGWGEGFGQAPQAQMQSAPHDWQGRGRPGGGGDRFAAAPQPQGHVGPQEGQGHGRHGEGDAARFAQAQPQPQAQSQPGQQGGGWRGGGGHAPHAEAQPQPQAQVQPQQHGGGDQGHGQGGGHEKHGH